MEKHARILSFIAVAIALAGPLGRAAAACIDCHQAPATGLAAGKHVALACESCHEGAAAHEAAPSNLAVRPLVHFDQESCGKCHQDQYDSFEIVQGGKTVYGGSDGGPTAPKGWSKTRDLPYWNVLIDGHPFVLETYEDRPMAVNQIEHQETIRPGSEACLECHGTKVAFAMGIRYRDATGAIRSIPATPSTVTMPDGSSALVPAKEFTLRAAHTIHDGTSHWDPTIPEWTEDVTTTVVPAGTRMWTFTDGVSLSGGARPQPYQVKTLVTLPAPQTAILPDLSPVTFRTIATFAEAGADISAMDPRPPVAALAKEWIYASLEALAFDGLDYWFDDPRGKTHFTGGGTNWPSVASGELCNQCHDPHAGTLRIVRKSLIAAIAQRGVNPYSPAGKTTFEFAQASRQDQIIAVCAQCHSEYVGGYSANTGLDQDYFPWAKPADLEQQYQSLFGYLQDWTHGGPVNPWQSADANARGFAPYLQDQGRFPIFAPLVKVQHPEAETFLGSVMYNAGATCTDCHSVRITRPDGTRYTSHWFASPLKLFDGFSGQTLPGKAITIAPQNPCARCHTTDTFEQSRARITGLQDQYFALQERTQLALVNGLKRISEMKAAGQDASAEIAVYQRAAMRWEYYTQAENSMGFHNRAEATTEVANARAWVDAFVPWPLTPVQLRVGAPGSNSLTVTFFDQSPDETSFRIERATLLQGPYALVATLPVADGSTTGDVSFTDAGLLPATTYFYRIAASNNAGTSAYSIWASGTTAAAPTVPSAPASLVATAASSTAIDLAWIDTSGDETGFRVERAADAAFTTGLVTFQLAANAVGLADSGRAPGTTSWYRVFAVNGAGSSAASNTASATTRSAPPAAPKNLVVTAVDKTAASLAWTDASSTEAGFHVQRSEDGATFVRIATLGANVARYDDAGLVRRKTYWYRVQAFNDSGTSPDSNVVSAKTR